MQRLLSIRALGLGLVALALMAGMGWLGRWQFGVYDDHQRAQAQATLRQPVVPIDRLLGPDDAFPTGGAGRPVTLHGVFLAASELYVRDLAGAQRRYSVVTPLRTASGSAVLVVRGAVGALGASPPPPTGQVSVRGFLEPSQSPGAPVNAQRVTDALSVSSLVNDVPVDLYSGYVLSQASEPSSVAATGLASVRPTLPDPSRWSGVRNLLYACQWWVFAAFVAFMWWRVTDTRLLDTRPDDVAPSSADAASLTPLG